MIVTCQRCETRFQLDDLRVPAAGARVRCSRCKHAFLALPPSASAEQTIHAAAEGALLAEAPTPPSVTEDLPEPLSSATEDEDEWQFADQAPPQPSPVHGPPSGTRADPWEGVLEDEKPPEARELDALGSPESWSFVSEEIPPLRPPRAASLAESGSRGAGVAIGRLRRPEPAATELATEPVGSPSQAFDRAGWLLTALLLLAIVHGIDWRGAPAPLRRSFPLGEGLAIEDLSLRRLENRVAGPLLVVGGVIVNPGTDAAGRAGRLVARVVSPGASAEAIAAAPRMPEMLREAPPEPSGDGGAPLLAEPLAPGARIPFEALIAGAPEAGARLELRLVPIPEAAVSVSSEKQEATAPATSVPSPPLPRPSSG